MDSLSQLVLGAGVEASVFDPGDVIGLAADLSADETCDLSVFIRSMQDGELTDTQFGDHVEAGPDRNVVAVLHTVTDDDGLASAEDFHTLVIRLPMRNSKLALGDLRLFVIPPSRGLGSKAATLPSFSA